MDYKYFPDYEDIRERLENLVKAAEDKDFGDLDLEMEGLYFNIEDLLELLYEKLTAAGYSDVEGLDADLQLLIIRATIQLEQNY